MTYRKGWTEGPWRIDGEDEVPSEIPVIEIAAGERETWKQIAYVQPSNRGAKFYLAEVDYANAALIAAAPRLFEALQKTEGRLRNVLKDRGYTKEHIDKQTSTALTALRAADGQEDEG